MPTGTGKTEVALSILRQLAVSTFVVAPVRDLMYQWHRRIAERLGYDAGIIGDSIYRVVACLGHDLRQRLLARRSLGRPIRAGRV